MPYQIPSEELIANINNRLADLQELTNRASVFFNDVMPQAGRLVLQDYANTNDLGRLLEKYRSVDAGLVKYSE